MKNYTIEARETFRKKMAEYFYLIGDDETNSYWERRRIETNNNHN